MNIELVRDLALKGLYGFLILLALYTCLLCAGSVYQETKIWKPSQVPSISIIGKIRVFCFNIVWVTCCAIGSILIVLKWIVTFGTSDTAIDSYWVETISAIIVMYTTMGGVKVVGKENLPELDATPAPVYIANHASQIDLAAVYLIGRRWKWVSKLEVLLMPGVGSIMLLGQHILIDRRKDKNRGKNGTSVANMFDKSNAAIQSGTPVFFFPQGTRKVGKRLGAKDGAFIVAQTNASALVPVSIEIPLTAWNSLYPLNLLWGGKMPMVTLTVHKNIKVTGKEDREKLKTEAMDQIYSVLPDYMQPKAD